MHTVVVMNPCQRPVMNGESISGAGVAGGRALGVLVHFAGVWTFNAS